LHIVYCLLQCYYTKLHQGIAPRDTKWTDNLKMWYFASLAAF